MRSRATDRCPTTSLPAPTADRAGISSFAPGYPRPRRRSPAGVLPPHVPTTGAPEAVHRDQQLVGRQPSGSCASRRSTLSRDAFAAAAPAPPMGAVLRVTDPAGQHCPVRLEPLPSHDETERVQTAERRHIRAAEDSVRHGEVSWMNGVGTSILRRPRHLPRTNVPAPPTPSKRMSL
jgi:hypothetical protein